MSETAGDQALAAAPLDAAELDQHIGRGARQGALRSPAPARSDVAAICARLTGGDAASTTSPSRARRQGEDQDQNNGSNSSIGSSIDIELPLNTWIHDEAAGRRQTLTAYVNGAMVGATVTDSNIPSGGIGLMVQRTNAVFDDVVVRARRSSQQIAVSGPCTSRAGPNWPSRVSPCLGCRSRDNFPQSRW